MLGESEEAQRIGVDGVICGHIHHATIEKMNDVEYINTGDWVESCTAVLEHFDGRMELVSWTEMRDEKSSDGRALAHDNRADDNRIVRLPRPARSAAKIAG